MKGGGADPANGLKASQLREELRNLALEEKAAVEHIADVEEALRELVAEEAHRLVLTADDLRSVAAPGGFNDDTLLVVRAPSGTALQVPDPNRTAQRGDRRYQIQLRSHGGCIDVFLVNGQGTSAPDADPLAAPDAASPAAVSAEPGVIRVEPMQSDWRFFEDDLAQGVSDFFAD